MFLFEFKLNGTREEALEQIKNKRYYEKYLGKGKRIVMVGAEFDREERNVGEYLAADV